VSMSRNLLAAVSVLLCLTACEDSSNPVQPPARVARPTLLTSRGAAIPNRYIVVLRSGGASPSDLANEMVAVHNAKLFFVYEHALRGFAAELDAAAIQALLHNPAVDYIEPDGIVTVVGTQTPTPSWGLDRIDQRSLPLSNSYSYGATGSGYTYTSSTPAFFSHIQILAAAQLLGLMQSMMGMVTRIATATAHT